MKKFAVLMALAACGVPTTQAPTQNQSGRIAQFIADVSPQLSPAEQRIAAACGTQSATPEELQSLAAQDGLDAATTGLISEIMTRDGSLACMSSNGVLL
ncbi:hypothetical protein [Litoreibacter albidus]|uniref:Uncharacterized protein n=1 Tax=Litoreibacter albidus TaxID=670155 RepID=A0A1H2ZHG2_9RHOB|nr:hypothetical protein [Litoreibacter albidus]SDX16149.1 hypothetical protein SAMN04488001_2558 [Litoreibacter albidus]